MIAYKGFQKDLKCRGFQFQEYGINETEKANCRQNGFHCAENPLDCLCYYPNWKMNNPVPVSLLSGDRKPQIRFLGNHNSGSGNLYHKSFRM